MLQTIANLAGVRVLGKDAQKKLLGGMAPSQSGCGIVYFDKIGGGQRDFRWASDGDFNGSYNGGTIDDAKAMSAANNSNPNALYRSGYCCDSCSNYSS